MPPLASNTGSPEAADCAAVMPKYGLIAGLVASVSRGPPDSVHRAPTGTIADDSVVAIEALPHLGAGAQPRDPPVFRKNAHLACPADIAEALQRRGFHALPAPPHGLADRADLEIASLDQAD